MYMVHRFHIHRENFAAALIARPFFRQVSYDISIINTGSSALAAVADFIIFTVFDLIQITLFDLIWLAVFDRIWRGGFSFYSRLTLFFRLDSHNSSPIQ